MKMEKYSCDTLSRKELKGKPANGSSGIYREFSFLRKIGQVSR